jgi:hypothetical protein
MPEEPPDYEFDNLLAAYIDADAPEELLRTSDPTLAERVRRHVESCADCQAKRRKVLDERGRRPPEGDEGA